MRLPDVEYNAGNVRPLAKMDDKMPLRKAQIDIDLSKAKLGAELDKSEAIAGANIRLAREMREVDRDAAWDQAKIAIDAHGHNLQMRGMARQRNIGLFQDISNIAMKAAGEWYQANEEAKAAKGSALYSAGITALTTKLENSHTINLAEFPNVDFSSIPENLLYDGVDELTGQKIRTAPSHLAAPLVYAAAEKQLYETASKGIESSLAQAKFANQIAQDQERGMASMIKTKATHERTFLQGQYEQALQSRITQGDLPGAVDTINSAEARGVFNAEEAGKKRATIVGDVGYSKLLKAVDSASGMGDLAQVREAVYSLPKEYQTSVRAAINLKENEFEKVADRQRTQGEQAMVGLNKLHATQIGLAEGGLKDYAKGVAAITKKFGGDPHLDDYITEFRQSLNTLRTEENLQKKDAISAWYKDPSQPIPAWAAEGKELNEMETFAAKIKNGTPLTTDTKTFVKLQRMAGEYPDEFRKLDLGLVRAALDDGDMEHFATLQSKLLEDSNKPVQIANANDIWDNAAVQVWGKENNRSKQEMKQADGAYRAYTVMVEQQTAANNGKPLATSDYQRIADDVFRSKIQANVLVTSGRDRTVNKTVTLADPDVAPYIPALTSILQANRVKITAESLLREYEAWLKNGRLEELQ